MKKRVCKVNEVPPDTAVAFEIDGRRVMVANAQDTFYAIDDTCSHAEASLAEGYLDVEECTVECPLHGAVFDLKSGEALEFPAEAPVRSYPVTIEGDDLVVDM